MSTVTPGSAAELLALLTASTANATHELQMLHERILRTLRQFNAAMKASSPWGMSLVDEHNHALHVYGLLKPGRKGLPPPRSPGAPKTADEYRAALSDLLNWAHEAGRQPDPCQTPNAIAAEHTEGTVPAADIPDILMTAAQLAAELGWPKGAKSVSTFLSTFRRQAENAKCGVEAARGQGAKGSKYVYYKSLVWPALLEFKRRNMKPSAEHGTAAEPQKPPRAKRRQS